MGARGSNHHRRVAIPALLELLEPKPGERVLDIGCGPGVLAPYLREAGAGYVGVDRSRKLISFARHHHGADGRFIQGDATEIAVLDEVGRERFAAATFLLSIQDIDPLADAVQVASGAVQSGGRVVVLMTHPCFRIPRQSGWGWDGNRKLRYRRIDRYLTPLAIPMKRYLRGDGATRSYHRPLERYIDAFAANGLLLDRVREVPYAGSGRSERSPRHGRQENRDIPLFLGLRAVKR